MAEVFFDESGHSGSNLIRPTEPVLLLASVSFSPEQLAVAEEFFAAVQSDEWKFRNFRKREKYLEALVSIFEQPWFSPLAVKAFVVHKRFMVVTKMVDLLQEPLARLCGVNLYEQGANLAMANLFYSVWPTFLGEERMAKLLESFVVVVRTKSPEALAEFSKNIRDCYDHLKDSGNDDMAAAFAPKLIACDNPDIWLDGLGRFEMDPLIPAYFVLLGAWGDELKAPFNVISDESKALASQSEILKQFADEALQQRNLSGPGGEVNFPLKSQEITMVDSKTSRQVQMADLIAGSLCSVYSAISEGRHLEEWQRRIIAVMATNPFCNGIWPSHNVTPEALGTEHLTGESILDYSMRILSGDPSTRNR